MVMEFFPVRFSKGLYLSSLCLVLCFLEVFISLLETLQTEAVATTFSTCLKLESFMT